MLKHFLVLSVKPLASTTVITFCVFSFYFYYAAGVNRETVLTQMGAEGVGESLSLPPLPKQSSAVRNILGSFFK